MIEQTPPKSPPKKPNILVRILALSVTAALLLGALALVVYRDHLNLDAFKRWLDYRNLETSEAGKASPFLHSGGDQPSFAYLDSGIVMASATGARYYSYSGDLYAEEVLNLERPVLSASQTTGVVYDAGGQDLFVFREHKECFHLTLDGSGDMLSARVNDAGWMAVTAQESGYKGSVTVYDSTYTKEMIQINLSSTFVVDAAVSPDNKTVAVITMGQSGGAFESQVRFYPINQKEPSSILSLGSLSVLDMDYENGLLWILSEDQLVIIPKDASAPYIYSFRHSYLKGCSFGGNGFAFLLLGRYRAGMANQMITIGPDGSVLASQELHQSTLGYDASGRYCGLLTGGSFTIYTSDLTPYGTLNGTDNARDVVLSPSGAALLVNTQQAWLYLPN